MDCGFIVLLMFVSVLGLVLFVWCDMSVMVMLFVVYFGIVMVLFVMLLYGKFVYGIFCCVVLFKLLIEKC